MHPGEHARTTPGKAAVVMASTGEAISYAELEARSNRVAHLFRRARLRPGDSVAFLVENHRRFFELAWGAQRAGLYYTAVSTRLTAAEASYIVNDCGARMLVTSMAQAHVASQLVATTPEVGRRIVLDGVLDGHDPYPETVEALPTDPIADETEGADLLYSSGTTGQPRGIKKRLSGAAFGTPPPVVKLVQALYGLDGDAVYLSPAPLYHAAPLRFCMAVHRLGGTVVVQEQFSPVEFLRSIERFAITHTQVVPTMFVRLLKLDEEDRARFDLSSLRVAVHGAGPCPAEVKRRMIEWWGPIVHEYYSATEGNGFVGCDSEEWLAHPGTVGRPLIGEVAILDGEGRVLPPGAVGDVYFAGGPDFEYHNDPEKTARAHDAEGRTTLGDVGYVDEDGYVYLTDRRSYVIIAGGVNVYPQEAESALTLHPKVADVAVFGVPNDDLGEEVKAVVQPADPAEAGPALEAELIAYCLERLAAYKVPRSIDFEAALPRDPTGKLYKRTLRDRYWRACTPR